MHQIKTFIKTEETLCKTQKVKVNTYYNRMISGYCSQQYKGVKTYTIHKGPPPRVLLGNSMLLPMLYFCSACLSMAFQMWKFDSRLFYTLIMIVGLQAK